MKKLLLIGGGHCHVEVMRGFVLRDPAQQRALVYFFSGT